MDCQSIELKLVDLRKFWGREEELFFVLDEHERKKADRFKFLALRRNYILSHAILRFEIARYIQLKPVAISYCYGPFGKPFLPLREIHFNMSHSMNWVLYGFSFAVEMGVDLECIQPSIAMDELPLSFFTTDEEQQILKLPLAKQKKEFYKLWTRKEAYLKAIGTGLQDAPAIIPPDQNWHFHEPFYTCEYRSSLAYCARQDLFLRKFS